MGKYDGHTPEPWTDGICTFGPDGKPIMVCTDLAIERGTGDKEARANAILIADAPKLLRERDEAVDEIREFCAHGCTDNDCAPNKRNADCGFGAYLKRIEEGK